jgi:ribonuclease T1
MGRMLRLGALLAATGLAVLVLMAAATARQTGAFGLGVVRAVDLPREAQRTLTLIKAGGPFPYRRDGVYFQNRERILPAKGRNYYREYTVPTPGASDRGARRIVAGMGAEYFYTNDHYRSFRRIVE